MRRARKSSHLSQPPNCAAPARCPRRRRRGPHTGRSSCASRRPTWPSLTDLANCKLNGYTFEEIRPCWLGEAGLTLSHHPRSRHSRHTTLAHDILGSDERGALAAEHLPARPHRAVYAPVHFSIAPAMMRHSLDAYVSSTTDKDPESDRIDVCHVPDMNLQMCTHLWNLSESERRSEICQLRSDAVV